MTAPLGKRLKRARLLSQIKIWQEDVKELETVLFKVGQIRHRLLGKVNELKIEAAQLDREFFEDAGLVSVVKTKGEARKRPRKVKTKDEEFRDLLMQVKGLTSEEADRVVKVLGKGGTE